MKILPWPWLAPSMPSLPRVQPGCLERWSGWPPSVRSARFFSSPLWCVCVPTALKLLSPELTITFQIFSFLYNFNFLFIFNTYSWIAQVIHKCKCSLKKKKIKTMQKYRQYKVIVSIHILAPHPLHSPFIFTKLFTGNKLMFSFSTYLHMYS